jgi:hypothetical protein
MQENRYRVMVHEHGKPAYTAEIFADTQFNQIYPAIQRLMIGGISSLDISVVDMYLEPERYAYLIERKVR